MSLLSHYVRGFCTAVRAFIRVSAAALALAAVTMPVETIAQVVVQAAVPVKGRHIGVTRERATQHPRSEGDQALVDGWPLYRTERGQAAFNDAMATLQVTDVAAPIATAFKGCADLQCGLSLPAVGHDGWLAPGRLWVSPMEYVLIAHSPRVQTGRSYSRRSHRGMKYFVFHEFHNSSRNSDPYDTISSHKGSVFVPFYMSKQGIDARGRRFVVVLQVAPHDVVSIHASNMGSAGPGIEVSKNATDELEPLQAAAGILVATMVKNAVPHLQVVNHRGAEGLPMLNAYEHRLATLRGRAGGPNVALPFVPAATQRVAMASGRLEDLITRRGLSPRIPVAERGFVPHVAAAAPALVRAPMEVQVRSGLTTTRQPPNFALVEPPRPVPRPACGMVGAGGSNTTCR